MQEVIKICFQSFSTHWDQKSGLPSCRLSSLLLRLWIPSSCLFGIVQKWQRQATRRGVQARPLPLLSVKLRSANMQVTLEGNCAGLTEWAAADSRSDYICWLETWAQCVHARTRQSQRTHMIHISWVLFLFLIYFFEKHIQPPVYCLPQMNTAFNFLLMWMLFFLLGGGFHLFGRQQKTRCSQTGVHLVSNLRV